MNPLCPRQIHNESSWVQTLSGAHSSKLNVYCSSALKKYPSTPPVNPLLTMEKKLLG